MFMTKPGSTSLQRTAAGLENNIEIDHYKGASIHNWKEILLLHYFHFRIIPNFVSKAKYERRKVFYGDQLNECKDFSGLFYVLPFQKVQQFFCVFSKLNCLVLIY